MATKDKQEKKEEPQVADEKESLKQLAARLKEAEARADAAEILADTQTARAQDAEAEVKNVTKAAGEEIRKLTASARRGSVKLRKGRTYTAKRNLGSRDYNFPIDSEVYVTKEPGDRGAPADVVQDWLTKGQIT